MGKLNVRIGPMRSIKTTELIALTHNYEEVGCAGLPIVLKPETDTKSADSIVSRVGVERHADIILPRRARLLTAVGNEIMRRSVERPEAIEDDTLLVIDEAQFLTPRQAEEAHAFASIRKQNAVIAAGISLDAMGKGFPGMSRLLELAHDIQVRDSWCRCKSKAFYNTKKIDGKFTFSGPQVEVDEEGKDKATHLVTYQSLCPDCYKDEVMTALEAGDEISSTTLSIMGLKASSYAKLVLTTTDKNKA